MTIKAPYGTWSSNITGNFVAEQSLKSGAPLVLKNAILWLEARPKEQGRQVVVIKNGKGENHDLLPAPWSARSKVHEYGGGAFTATDSQLYFVNSQDQQIYVMDFKSQQPMALTNTKNCRFGDLSINQEQNQLAAVCEQHGSTTDEPENFLVLLDLHEYSQTITNIDEVRIGGSHDFFSNPRFSPCGQWLAYITWDHPNMPWDNTQLWRMSTSKPKQIYLLSGNKNESIVQPQWSANGDLFWVSDKNNWWNIYCLTANELSDALIDTAPKNGTCVYAKEAEFATPQWVFGMSSYCVLNQNTIFASYKANGLWHALVLEKSGQHWQAKTIETNLTYMSELASNHGKVVFSGASATLPLDLYSFEGNEIKALCIHRHPPIKNDDKSIGQTIEFATGNNATAYAIFYPPQNSQYQAPEGDKPPLIVFGHGGPTGCSEAVFSYKIQFWTQRGFAVVDVNYRGSTGYGRRFRQSLQKQWGVYDVQDLAAAAEFLTQQGLVHPHQRVVRGGSAGGFTVLAALTDTHTFNAGCTLYGVADLETLATDTHKFESRYLDGLIGPYPQQKALYIERSPIHKVSNISCPVLIFQGAEDKVVPKEQAEIIFDAVQKQGLPVAYVLYENEGHGFRQADNIQHQAEAECYFYQQVLGLTQDENGKAPITIQNWKV